MILRRTVFFAPRKLAMARDAPGLSFRSGPASELAHRATVAPFHMAHSFVSRSRSRTTPRGVANGTRVAVFPRKAEVAVLRANGGRYHSRHHVWSLPADSAFLRTKTGGAMRSIAAGYAHVRRRDGQGSARHEKTSRLFQDYIERATMAEAQRAEEVEADELGLISIGNLGETRADRQGFWAAVEQAEKRADARLQCRIIAELPYWVEASDRRSIVERFGRIFEDRQLGWWAAVHKPDVAKGSDPRNFHLHLVYHDRAFLGHEIGFERGPDPNAPDPNAFGQKDGPLGQKDGLGEQKDGLRLVRAGPIFEKFKDREARGEAWIVGIKAQLADIVNDVVLTAALRDGAHPVRLMFPGSYADLGLEGRGQRHLGAKRTALERIGVGTRVGLENLGVVEAGFERQDKKTQRSWKMALRLLLQAELYADRMGERSRPALAPPALSPEVAAAGSGLGGPLARSSEKRSAEMAVFLENLAKMLALADEIVEKHDAIMSAFSDAELARMGSLDTPEAQRSILSAEKRVAESGEIIDFSRTRIALRDRALEKLLEKAQNNPQLIAEIQSRRDEMLVWEAAPDVETAARQRRLIESEWQCRRAQAAPAAADTKRAASRVSIALLAAELAEHLAFWREAGQTREAGGLLDPLSLPYPVSMPPEGVFEWANGYEKSLGEPLLRARFEGSEADWTAYLVRRRLLEAQEAAKMLARTPGARRQYDAMFEASFGVSVAGLAQAFAAEEASILRRLGGLAGEDQAGEGFRSRDWDR